MKMGNRKLKRLDTLSVRVLNKPRLTLQPVNRAERRALAKVSRKKVK